MKNFFLILFFALALSASAAVSTQTISSVTMVGTINTDTKIAVYTNNGAASFGLAAITPTNLAVAILSNIKTNLRSRLSTAGPGANDIQVSGLTDPLLSGISAGAGAGAIGSNSVVLGGFGNTASNKFSVVVGGYANRALGDGSFIGSGAQQGRNGIQQASGQASFIGTGVDNYALGNFSFVGTGNDMYVYGNYSSVLGGIGNHTSGDYSSVLGGERNNNGDNFDPGGVYACIAGGSYNTLLNATNFFIGTGIRNNAQNVSHGAILGGTNNTLVGAHIFAIGSDLNLSTSYTVNLGFGSSNFLTVAKNSGTTARSLTVSGNYTNSATIVRVFPGGTPTAAPVAVTNNYNRRATFHFNGQIDGQFASVKTGVRYGSWTIGTSTTNWCSHAACPVGGYVEHTWSVRLSPGEVAVGQKYGDGDVYATTGFSSSSAWLLVELE